MSTGASSTISRRSATWHTHTAPMCTPISSEAVGAVPLDVRATGVDFAATATYKWLMGDFALGFLFVREGLLGSVIRHKHWSYESSPDTNIHLSPLDSQFPTPVTWTAGGDATRYFQLGTMANGVAAALRVSLPYIWQLRVENIQAWRQPMLKRLQSEMPRLGFAAQTPPDSTSPIVTFAHKDAEAINNRLQAARIAVQVAPYYMRIAVDLQRLARHRAVARGSGLTFPGAHAAAQRITRTACSSDCFGTMTPGRRGFEIDDQLEYRMLDGHTGGLVTVEDPCRHAPADLA